MRIKISIADESGSKFKLSSDIPNKENYTQTDVAEYLEELARMLKASVLVDKEIF